MALAYDAARVTRDVDAVFKPHGIVLEEARNVADTLGLPHWEGVDDGGGPGDGTTAEQRRGALAGQLRDHLPGQARVLGVQELRADLVGDAGA
jgi:hypothetical protein